MKLPFTRSPDERLAERTGQLDQARAELARTAELLSRTLEGPLSLHAALQDAQRRSTGETRALLAALAALQVGELARALRQGDADALRALTGESGADRADPAPQVAALLASRTHTLAVYLTRLAPSEPFTAADVQAQGERDLYFARRP